MLILAFFHVFYFGIWRPVVAIRNRANVGQGTTSRRAYYRRVTLDSAAFGVMSAIAVGLLRDGQAWPLLQQVQMGKPGLSSLTTGVVMLVVMTWIDGWHSRRRAKVAPGYYLSEPPSPQDRPVWMTMALVAGIGEELTWRLAQPVLIGGLTGSSAVGIAASAVGFGIGHVRAGWLWVAMTGGFALAFQAVALSVEGGLWVAMAVHVGINVAAGLRHLPTPTVSPSP